ncbi:MAG: M23 family metallopeptidase [Proteobacteria bacterium]|nr:M23 family metallopeptidase [Burkholderiales bacterium]
MLAAALPLFGVAAAFGIDPGTPTNAIALRTVVEAVVLPALEAENDGGSFVREERVMRGDTVSAVLARLDIRDSAAIDFIRLDRTMRPLHQLAPGRAVRAETGIDGVLHWLEYATGQGTVLRLERGDDQRLTTSDRPLQLERRVEIKSGEIRSSLFAATDAANLPDAIATQLAEMFSSDIDFHRDLRRGDTFTVVYEAFHHQGERVRIGRVLAAEFINGRRVFQGVWFDNGVLGQGGYYTPGGLSLRRAFLRSPLEFSRITSGFSQARYHPILQQMRAHKGIDYAAPTGTPIKAVAHGTVERIGREGGYGNLVVLAHPNNTSTVYGHLSGFAPKLRTGARVNQGDVIGYVGMTGLATGPHLHYEFRMAGVHMDPLKVALPEAMPITAALRPAFEVTTAVYSEQLRILRGSNLARLE